MEHYPKQQDPILAQTDSTRRDARNKTSSGPPLAWWKMHLDLFIHQADQLIKVAEHALASDKEDLGIKELSYRAILEENRAFKIKLQELLEWAHCYENLYTDK